MSERYYYSVPTKTVQGQNGDPDWIEPDIVSNNWQAQYFDDNTCLVRTAQQLEGLQELSVEDVRAVCLTHGVDPDTVLLWT